MAGIDLLFGEWSLFASEGADHITTIFDAKTGVALTVLRNTGKGLAFSPDGSTLAVRGAGQFVDMYETRTGKPLFRLAGPGPFAFSPDGTSIANVGSNETIGLYDTQTGASKFSFRDNSDTVYSIAFTPDGGTLATANLDTMVRLFDVQSGRSKGILQGHTDRVLQVAFSPDGSILASGSKDATVRLWDPATGKSKAILRGHRRGIKAIAFSPDSTTLATGGWDYGVRFWDVSDARQIGVIAPPKATVMSLAYSPKGDSLAIGQWGVTLWATPAAKDLPPENGLALDLHMTGGKALDNDAPSDPGVQSAPVKAGREYFLVGSRHIYHVGPDPTWHVAERKEIEESYMDGIAGDDAAYKARIDFGGIPADQAKFRDADMEELANERDQNLGSLYQLRDDLRESHPELKAIDVDGPYQVIGLDYRIGTEDSVVFDDMVAEQPWPDYLFSGESFGGWTYGTVYPATIFFETYSKWRERHRERWFYSGFFGHHGRILFANGLVVGRVGDFGERSAYVRDAIAMVARHIANPAVRATAIAASHAPTPAKGAAAAHHGASRGVAHHQVHRGYQPSRSRTSQTSSARSYPSSSQEASQVHHAGSSGTKHKR